MSTFMKAFPNKNFGELYRTHNLDMVNALYALQPNNTRNLSEDEFAFQIVCRDGYLDIAKKLLELNPNINISAFNDYAFKNACRKGHLEIVEWLQSLNPERYQYTIDASGKIWCNIQ